MSALNRHPSTAKIGPLFRRYT